MRRQLQDEVVIVPRFDRTIPVDGACHQALSAFVRNSTPYFPEQTGRGVAPGVTRRVRRTTPAFARISRHHWVETGRPRPSRLRTRAPTYRPNTRVDAIARGNESASASGSGRENESWTKSATDGVGGRDIYIARKSPDGPAVRPILSEGPEIGTIEIKTGIAIGTAAVTAT